jgi:hypothetical protein
MSPWPWRKAGLGCRGTMDLLWLSYMHGNLELAIWTEQTAWHTYPHPLPAIPACQLVVHGAPSLEPCWQADCGLPALHSGLSYPPPLSPPTHSEAMPGSLTAGHAGAAAAAQRQCSKVPPSSSRSSATANTSAAAAAAPTHLQPLHAAGRDGCLACQAGDASEGQPQAKGV